MPALRRSKRHRPRSDRIAGTSSTSAATQTRAVTAAPGLQPASMRPRAQPPDMPNANAAPTASGSPNRTALGCAPPRVVSSATVLMACDATRQRCKMST